MTKNPLRSFQKTQRPLRLKENVNPVILSKTLAKTSPERHDSGFPLLAGKKHLLNINTT